MKKIIDNIMQEAASEAKQLAAEAERDSEKRLDEAESECKRIEAEEQKRCKAELQGLIKRSESARASRQRTRLLGVKQEILKDAVDTAYKSITSVSGEEYDEILKGLLKPRLHGGECVIYFPPSKKPSKQLDAAIKELAAKSCCKYTLSYEREDIEDGFVLVYGGIEENCSFSTLFNERRSEISDYAAQLLLGTEE